MNTTIAPPVDVSRIGGTHDFTAGELDGFRAAQGLAYECASNIAATIETGDTEKVTAARMLRWLQDKGVRDWFHRPFAWFGDRTAFAGFKAPTQFFPTNRRISKGMPYILDVAPVLEQYGCGYTADIGFTGAFGDNAMVDLLMDGLADHRRLILDGVNSGATLRTIYENCDRLMARQGFENRHRAYPFGVIAHRVDLVSAHTFAPVLAGFGLNNLANLARDTKAGRRGQWSPLWGPSRFSDHLPVPGLWAVEPHLGFRGVGAKFEELLVITDTHAFWLDDDVPHVNRWTARGADHALASIEDATQ